MIELSQITKLHIELTTRCNARCPMCPRNFRGMDYNSGYPDAEINLDKFKKIFAPEFLQQIKLINFNGNLGDCSTVADLDDILQYVFAICNSRVGVVTNGSTRTSQWWSKLPHPRLTVTFDLDGLKDTHDLYRLDTSWDKIVDNARAFIDAGGEAVWKMILFDHNRHQVDACRELSRKLGFKYFMPVDHGRNQGPVFDRQGRFSHWLGAPYDQVPVVQDLLEHHITWFDTKPSNEWGIDQSVKIDCQHLKNKELYVAADGSVYPCCYLGFYPTSMKHPGNSQIAKIVTENNALEHGLEHCIQWFNLVEKSWQLPDVDQGRLYTCITACKVKR